MELMEWEQIDSDLYRTKIINGWLVKHESSVYHNTIDRGIIDGYDFRTSICFVIDPTHAWIITPKGA